MGIIICGLNGSGKSALGKILAEKFHFLFIDIENLYFPKTNSNYIYDSPRTRENVAERLLCEIRTHETLFLLLLKEIMERSYIHFFSVPYCLMFHGILDCSE